MNRILRFLGFFSLIFCNSLLFCLDETDPLLGVMDEENTIITEQRDLINDFTSIQVDADVTLYITVGEAYNLTLKGYKKDVQEFKTVVEGVTLIISRTRELNAGAPLSSGTATVNGQVYRCAGRLGVTTTGKATQATCCYDGICESLTSLEPSSSVEGEQIEIHLTLPTLKYLLVRGSGGTVVNNLKENRCHFELIGSGNLNASSINVQELTITLAGAGDIVASGESNQLIVKVKGSGNVDTSQLLAKDGDVFVEGSGDARICAENSLMLNVRGSGHITYNGNPDIRKSIQGSGSIRKEII